ncbi:unnamed protein product [Effrenium voratum]|nr:unnamed protein product [Effrenium voratum]
MKVDVCLPSGDCCSVAVSPETPVRELKAAAQHHFQRLFKLSAAGTAARCKKNILESGSVVTWGNPDCGGDSSQVQEELRHVQRIQATHPAFAAILESGAVVTWGNPTCGGESSQVQEELRNVQRIQATHPAFAAILESGAVVTWGNPEFGRDSSEGKPDFLMGWSFFSPLPRR